MTYGGFHWPDSDVHGKEHTIRQVRTAIPAFLEHVEGRNCIIQAGGNVGVYPKILREHFAHVVTAEPEVNNWRCLLQNIPGDVRAHFAAFGEAPGWASMHMVDNLHCGTWQIRLAEVRTAIPVLTIDSLDLEPDAIWLDIEGHELPALRGALKTIERCKPLIGLEENGLGPPCAEFMAGLGYEKVARIGQDNLYKVA